ncbi:SGNH/GDSL hydrolase family protein [Melaminivora sp.]
MAANWLRRTVLAAACATAAMLTACGSSTTESALAPQRLLAFGDGMADVGQKGTRYSVNNGSVNNWTLQLAARYNLPLQPSATGGLGYAQGNARVSITPDAAGNASTLSVTQQVDAFLASQRFAANDLVLVNAGLSDIVAGMAAVRANAQTPDQYLANARKAGVELAAQVRRLVAAGAGHILVASSYDLSRTPWATAINGKDLLSQASNQFNQGLLVSIEDLGKNVLYVDHAYYVNVFQGSPGAYGFTDSTTPVCNSVDPGPGIGIGSGEVNSLLCNANTLLPGTDADRYVFADKLYLTPNAQRQLGDYTFDRLRTRW